MTGDHRANAQRPQRPDAGIAAELALLEISRIRRGVGDAADGLFPLGLRCGRRRGFRRVVHGEREVSARVAMCQPVRGTKKSEEIRYLRKKVYKNAREVATNGE